MKIGIYGRVLLKPGSGIVRYSFELTESLLKYAPDNEYTIYFRKGAVPKLKFKGKYKVREVSLPYFLWRTPLFTRILDRDGIDVYHSTAYTLPLVPRAMRKVAMISTFHGLHSEYFWHSLKENVYSLLNYRTAALFADRIISVSDKLRHEIHEKYGKPLSRIDVTYFGLNKDLKPLSGRKRSEVLGHLREKYGIRGSHYVLYVGGGMAKNKNFPTIIKAWGILKRKYGFSLPLIVTRVEMDPVKNLMEEEGLRDGEDIIGLRWIEGGDLKYLYACALLSVYPSTYEGVGFPIVEAMACGTPVITSNVSAMPEASGGAGLLVNDPMNPEEWANRILALSRNEKLRSRLIRMGLKRARRFTWKRVVADTIDSYRKALKGQV